MGSASLSATFSGVSLRSTLRKRIACLYFTTCNKTELIQNMGTRITKMRSDKYDIQGQNFKEETAKISTTTSSMTSKNTSDTVEQSLCNVDDLRDNEMKEFKLAGDYTVLLVKERGQFSAFGNKCTHYGALLVNGVLCNGYIRCPWHGACFNSKTGDIEDFPGLDSIPKYEVEVENNKVKIRAKKSDLESQKRVKSMTTKGGDSNEIFVIVGGGAAGAKCVETLRQHCFRGKILIITKEAHLPYDRPKLSKALDMTADKIALRNANFYEQYDIEFMLNKEVVSVNSNERCLCLDDGTRVPFTKLLLATGGIPRKLSVPGSDLDNIKVLRSVDDANEIAHQSRGKRVVILGTSFIGMECAAFLVGKATSVHVVGSSSVPFEPVLGEEVGARLKKLFEDKGVVFHSNDTIVEFLGSDGTLKEVILRCGSKIEADLCILGIGVQPSTNFLENSGICLSDDGYVCVDEYMRSNIDGIYAAGDISKFPLFFKNECVNIQHWQMAHYQGHVAGLNMSNVVQKIHSVPFFWTMFFGVSLRYTGYAAGYDDVIIEGNLENLEFVAYYLKGNKVGAVATMKRDPVAAQFAEILRAGKTVTKEEIKSLDMKKKLFG